MYVSRSFESTGLKAPFDGWRSRLGRTSGRGTEKAQGSRRALMFSETRIDTPCKEPVSSPVRHLDLLFFRSPIGRHHSLVSVRLVFGLLRVVQDARPTATTTRAAPLPGLYVPPPPPPPRPLLRIFIGREVLLRAGSCGRSATACSGSGVVFEELHHLSNAHRLPCNGEGRVWQEGT